MRQVTLCLNGDGGSRGDGKGGGEPPDFLRPIAVRSWTGVAGRLFRHSIYSLLGCPPTISDAYVLVQHTPDGRRIVLGLGRCQNGAASKNLADIRRRGAALGANEVHLYDCLADPAHRAD